MCIDHTQKRNQDIVIKVILVLPGILYSTEECPWRGSEYTHRTLGPICHPFRLPICYMYRDQPRVTNLCICLF